MPTRHTPPQRRVDQTGGAREQGRRCHWRLVTTRDFGALWWGQLISQIGDGLTKVALLWFVLQLTGSAVNTAVVGILQTLPPLLLCPLLGVYLDSLPKKHVMLAADLARAAVLASIPALYALGALSLEGLYGLVFLNAIVSTAFGPALAASVPQLVGSAEVTAANALIQTTTNAGILVGPAASGLLIALLAPHNVLYVNAAAFLVSAGCLLLMRNPLKGRRSGLLDVRTTLHHLRAGLRFVGTQQPVLRTLTGATMLYTFGAGSFVYLLPGFIKTELQAGPVELGWLWSALGVGMLGASLALTMVKHLGIEARLRLLTCAVALEAITVWLLSQAHALPVALGIVTVIGASAGVFTPIGWSIIQEVTPSTLRGRVFAIMSTVAMASASIGMAAFGWISDASGAATGLWGVAAVLSGVAALLASRRAQSRCAPGSQAGAPPGFVPPGLGPHAQGPATTTVTGRAAKRVLHPWQERPHGLPLTRDGGHRPRPRPPPEGDGTEDLRACAGSFSPAGSAEQGQKSAPARQQHAHPLAEDQPLERHVQEELPMNLPNAASPTRLHDRAWSPNAGLLVGTDLRSPGPGTADGGADSAHATASWSPVLSLVELPSQPLGCYQGLIDDGLLPEIRRLADDLQQKTIVHVNATPGGGVAELLRSVVPFTGGLGLATEWYHLAPHDPFFQVTRHVHNSLQGGPWVFDAEAREIFLAHSRRLAEAIADIRADLVMVHDPQPCFAIAGRRGNGKTVWHCHIDTSTPNRAMWDFFHAVLPHYDRWVFCRPDYVHGSLPRHRVRFVRPAIDPLTAKNRPLALFHAKNVLARLGIDPDRPLVTQVSRFDPWKDPHGVIDAYRLAKRRIPALQLALVGVIAAQDDTEAARVLRQVARYRGADPDIHLFSDPAQVGDLEVNAFQRASDVIVQKSLREGFGLTVAEALWKGTPVIGGNCGGIRLQIESGRSGYLVSSSEQCADRLVSLLQDENLRTRLGMRGREVVRQRYLMPRLLRDYLRLAAELFGNGKTRSPQALLAGREDSRAA